MQKVSLSVKIIVSLLVLAVLLVFAMPRTVKFGYDYRVGKVWKYETLISQFDFPILKTSDQLQKEKSEAKSVVVPYYKFTQDKELSNIKTLEETNLGEYSYLKPKIVSFIASLYQTGIISDEGVRQLNPSSPSDVLYIQKDRRAIKKPVGEVYKLSDAKSGLQSLLSDYGADSVLRSRGIYDLIEENLVFDQITTDLVNSQADKSVSPTMGFVSAGELIVSNGELITADIAQILDSYKKEYETNLGYDGPSILYWLGNILLALALVTLLYFSMFLSQKKTIVGNGYFYILLLFAMSSALAFFAGKKDLEYLLLVPFPVFALYLQAFFRGRVIIPVYTVFILPLLIFTHFGMPLFVMYLLAGMVAVYLFKFFGKGWKQFVLALLVYGVMILVLLAFRFLGMINGDMVRVCMNLFIGSMLMVAAYPLIYLFEKIFNLVSISRLEELSNTNNPIIRKLELLAPGTFQHSLQVMNMSVAATRAIGGDIALVRAGALYHDIGKMENPLCFVENESLLSVAVDSKYHQGLDPLHSAQDIIKHVTDGVAIAKSHNLPESVIDYIRSHHGTTTVTYFYNKYMNDGGDPALKEEFVYKGIKPYTKEQAVLMICDSVEAASRTLGQYDAKVYDNFVEQIVASKMEMGQFDQTDITLRELNTVKSVLKNYLAQIYHERIVYPKRK